MFALLEPQTTQKFSILALDDNTPEMELVRQVAKDEQISFKIFPTTTKWGSHSAEFDENTIVISDNHIDGVNDLSSLGLPDVKTSLGEQAGIQILTRYCDGLSNRPGLRVLLTGFPIRKEAKNSLGRRVKKGESEVHVILKHDSDAKHQLRRLLRSFVFKRKSDFVREKIKFIEQVWLDWGLPKADLARVFGYQSEEDDVWKAAVQGTTSADVETRCDLIYRMKLNLSVVFGETGKDAEFHWLRAKSGQFSGLSPLEFIQDGKLSRLLEAVAIMDGEIGG